MSMTPDLELLFMSDRLCLISLPFTFFWLLLNPSLSSCTGMWVLVSWVTALGVHQTHLQQAWDGAACWTNFLQAHIVWPHEQRCVQLQSHTLITKHAAYLHRRAHSRCDACSAALQFIFVISSFLYLLLLAACEVCIPHVRPWLLSGNFTGCVCVCVSTDNIEIYMLHHAVWKLKGQLFRVTPNQ